jgi:hypothetical protein
MRVYVIAVLLFCAISAQALVDIRIFGLSAASAILGIAVTVVASWALSLWFMFGRRGGVNQTLDRPRHPYWTASVMIATYIIACDALGIVGAFYTGLRVVTGPQYLRIGAVVEATVSSTALEPQKAW